MSLGDKGREKRNLVCPKAEVCVCLSLYVLFLGEGVKREKSYVHLGLGLQCRCGWPGKNEVKSPSQVVLGRSQAYDSSKCKPAREGCILIFYMFPNVLIVENFNMQIMKEYNHLLDSKSNC